MAVYFNRIHNYVLLNSKLHNLIKIIELPLINKVKIRSRPTTRDFHRSNVEHTMGPLTRKGRAEELITFKKRIDQLKFEGLWQEIHRRSEFIDWNYDAEIFALSKRLNEEFDETLIKEALVDSSYVRQEIVKLKTLGMEPSVHLKSHDDLCKVGLNIMENFLPKYLRAVWPSLPEEGIQDSVKFLTSDETMATIAKGFGLKDLIMTEIYPPTTSIYAKSFSAMVAALNSSSGLDTTQKFITELQIPQLVGQNLWDFWDINDPLVVLGQILRNNGLGPAEPRIIGELGKNTIEACYHIAIYYDKNFISSGYGESINEGVKTAAYNCLSKFFDQSLKSNPLPFKRDWTVQLREDPNISLDEWRLSENLLLLQEKSL